jgi:hypothetical protein
MFEDICRFVYELRLRIKLMSDTDFVRLLDSCDYQQKIYALYFRYC